MAQVWSFAGRLSRADRSIGSAFLVSPFRTDRHLLARG